MQERGADGVLVHVEVLAEDEGHLDGVVDIGLARAAALVAVVVGRKVIGAVDLCPLIIVEVGTRGLLKHAEVGSVGNRGLLCRRRRRSRGGHGRGNSGSLGSFRRRRSQCVLGLLGHHAVVAHGSLLLFTHAHAKVGRDGPVYRREQFFLST